MKNIKTYESFCDENITNEGVNWKNAIVGAALAASLSSCVEHEGDECLIYMKDRSVKIGIIEDSNPNEIIIQPMVHYRFSEADWKGPNEREKDKIGEIAVKKDEISGIIYSDDPKYNEYVEEVEQAEKREHEDLIKRMKDLQDKTGFDLGVK
jgi:hypothetical protein